MTTITVERGKHAQQKGGKDEEVWLVSCQDDDVARLLSIMLANSKWFKAVTPHVGSKTSFIVPKKGQKPYKKALEAVARDANVGNKVKMVYS